MLYRMLPVLLLMTAGVAPGQPTGFREPRLFEVHGEVAADRNRNLTGYCVELEEMTSRQQTSCLPVTYDGQFEARLPAGQYKVRVCDAYRQTVREDIASVGEHSHELQVRLPSAPGSGTPGGVVSAHRLAHAVPKKAAHEFMLAMKASKADGSLEHLRRAVEIDPDFAEAHNNLGALYVKQGLFEQAEAEFRRSVEIDPDAAAALQNLAQALVRLRRYPEAEQVARRALRLNPAAGGARYILGSSLMGQKRFSDEAMSLLDSVADEYPAAIFAVAQIAYVRGDRRKAAAYLRRYIEDGRGEQKAAAVAALKTLE